MTRLNQRAVPGIAHFFQPQVRPFLEEYLVSETGRAPFGGRDRELERLDAWLFDDSAAPRMLITAPAGRGKSALLVQWMMSLEERGRLNGESWNLAFMPISIRIGTNRPEVFYLGLAQRLAEISGNPLPPETLANPANLPDVVREQVDVFAQSGLKTLIVLDGLDEALQGSFDPTCLPPVLPPKIKILFSARWQIGDTDSGGWLQRLGWTRQGAAENCELERLDAAGVTDVLARLVAPLGAPADESAKIARLMIDRLVALTEGEPLLVRYYAEDLWRAGRSGVRVSRDDLDALNPGFGAYFERWFELQEKLWREEGADVDREAVDRALAILAFAFGPLEAADLQGLMRAIYGVEAGAPDRLLAPLRRFVLGNGHAGAGYVLSHPRIGEHLKRERFSASAPTLRRGFATWALERLREANARRLAPGRVSAYALQFLAHHLEDVEAPVSEFMEMVEDGWRRAWEHLEGGQRGFANCIQSAWAALRRQGPTFDLGAQWRCALALSSIKTVGCNTPTELLIAAVSKGVLTLHQAIHLAELKGASEDGVRAMARLAAVAVAAKDLEVAAELALGALHTAAFVESFHAKRHPIVETVEIVVTNDALPPEMGAAVCVAAYDAARSIKDPVLGSQALTELAPHLEPELRRRAIADALRAAKAIESEVNWFHALATLAPYLPPEQKRQAFADMRKAAHTNSGEWWLPREFATLASHLEPEPRQRAIADALQAARAIESEFDRSRALIHLAPLLDSDQIADALRAAKDIAGDRSRAGAVAALASRLAPDQKRQTLADEFQTAKAIHSEADRARALADLAPCLTPDQIVDAFQAAKAICNEHDRSFALVRLAPYLELTQTSEMLEAAKGVDNPLYRSQVLEALAPRLPPDLRQQVLSDVRRALVDAPRTIEDFEGKLARPHMLAKLTHHLPPEQQRQGFDDALQAAKSIDYEGDRALALSSLPSHLTPGQIADALQAAKAIWDHHQRSFALAALALYLTAEQIAGALQAAKTIGDTDEFSRAMVALAPYLAPEARRLALDEALQAVKAFDHEERLYLLADLAPHWEPYQKRLILDETLHAVRLINGEDNGEESADRLLELIENHSRVLVALAPHLQPDLKRQALDAALRIAQASPHGWPCADLASHFTLVQIADVLALIRTTASDCKKSEVITALAARLSLEQIEAIAIDEDHLRVNALTALAPCLSPEQTANMLEMTKTIGINDLKVGVLAALAPRLSPEQIADVLEMTKTIDNDRPRGKALAALAPRLTLERIPDALSAVEAIDDYDCWLNALVALAPRLTPEQVSDALRSAEALGDDCRWSGPLAKLVLRLPDDERRQAVELFLNTDKTTGDVEDWLDWEWPLALDTLAPLIEQEERRRALEGAVQAATTIDDAEARFKTLILLEPDISPSEVSRSSCDDLMTGLLDIISCLRRDKALRAVEDTVELTLSLGGEEALVGLRCAISDTRRWYP